MDEYLLLYEKNLYAVNEELSLKKLFNTEVLVICDSSYIKRYDWYYVEDPGYNTIIDNKLKPTSFHIFTSSEPYVGVVFNSKLDCIIAVTMTKINDVDFIHFINQSELRSCRFIIIIYLVEKNTDQAD